MTDYHPLIVHFPIALLIVGSIAELAGHLLKRDDLRHFAFWAIILGVASTGAAYLSGSMAEEQVEHLPGIHSTLEMHEELATITLVTWIGLGALRILLAGRQWLTSNIFYLYIVLLLAGSVLLGTTGYWGGQLVYQHGAGVKMTSATQQIPFSKIRHHDDDDD